MTQLEQVASQREVKFDQINSISPVPVTNLPCPRERIRDKVRENLWRLRKGKMAITDLKVIKELIIYQRSLDNLISLARYLIIDVDKQKEEIVVAHEERKRQLLKELSDDQNL